MGTGSVLGTDGVVQLEVVDDGTRQEPQPTPPVTRGRGLWMADGVVDELHMGHHEDQQGTVVTVRHPLHQPATLASGIAHRTQESSRSEYSARLQEGPPRVLRVSGPIDGGTAAAFADRLAVASRGGACPVIIDLTGVDVLASAGVSVLLAARDKLRHP